MSLPTVIHSGELTIFGITLHVHNLSDGRRVIETADFDALMAAMADPATPEPKPSELDALARLCKGSS